MHAMTVDSYTVYSLNCFAVTKFDVKTVGSEPFLSLLLLLRAWLHFCRPADSMITATVADILFCRSRSLSHLTLQIYMATSCYLPAGTDQGEGVVILSD
jgi:hypothetical protein